MSLKVLVLTPSLYDTSPGQRFRIEQWARYLERDGIKFTFVSFEDDALHSVLYQPGQYTKKTALIMMALARRLKIVPLVKGFDVVFIYREAALAGPAIIERLIARTGVPIVYDFDDPIWLPYRSPTHGVLTRLKFLGKTSAICRLASIVVVGNRLLATYASRYAKEVQVIPSTIDLEQYPPKEVPANGGPIALGWTGSHSTLPFLELIAGPLKKLAAEQRFRIYVVAHAEQVQLNGLPDVVGKKWQPATEAMDLHDFDVGIAPFPEDGWAPWRCHGKVLQYMAIGIPTVATPIGIIPDYIKDGVNGFLAATEKEWVDKLSLLLNDSALRWRMGRAARELVADNYAARVWAPKVRQVLEQAAQMRS